MQIKQHSWCHDIDWDKIIMKDYEPPFKPFFHKSNFDPEYTSMNPILDDEDVLMTLEEL